MVRLARAVACMIVIVAFGSPGLAGEYLDVKDVKELLKPTDTEAAVYIVRPAFTGKTVKFWAFVDDRPMGVTKGKTYVVALVPAGSHLFWSRAENVSAIRVEVEAGRRYYLKQAARMGGMKARVKMQLVDDAEGIELVKKCKLAEMTDEGRERAAEIVAEKLQVAEEKAGAGDSDDD